MDDEANTPSRVDLGADAARQRQLALDAARLGWWHYDPISGVARYDERYKEIFGVTGAERPNEEILTLLHPDDLPRVWAAVEAALDPNDPRPYAVEYRVHRPDGSMRWVEAHGVASFEGAEPARRATSFVGTVADITDRKQLEEALRNSELFYRQMLESIPGMVFTTRPDGYCDYQAQQWVEYTGVPMAEHLGDGWNRLLHPDDRPRAFDAWLTAVEGRAPYDLEYRVRRHDGAYEWFKVIGRPILDPAGQVVRWFGVAMNIEMLKRAEGALRDSERRWQQLADSMPQIIWASRPDGFLDYYNRRWYELTGADPDACGDQSWLPILHPDDRQKCLDVWYESVLTGKPYQIEYRFKFPSRGEYRWHLGRALPVRDVDGKIVRWFGTCTDIHDQKQAEEALREADRRKDEFLRMLSHELRNPLAPIRNATYILRHAPPGSEQARRAQGVIERQSEHLTNLVDDLLDLSRIARGKVQLRCEQVDLCEVVGHTAEDFRDILEDRGVALDVHLPHTRVHANADATRLAQIIGNLLHNASKFTRGGDTVTVSLTRAAEGAELVIRDTGAGIEPEIMPRIFDPFTQGHRTLARSEGGLGLGLALVKGLVELHGGTVGATSGGTGRGAEFVVRLPLCDGFSAERRGAGGVERGNGARRVLVVDDNVDAADSLADIISMLGHSVEVAYDGASALAKARASPPDVVLCDVGLPGMSGYEVATLLRGAGSMAQLFAVSGYAQPEDVRKAIDAGFDGHVAKPPRIEDIERVLA